MARQEERIAQLERQAKRSSRNSSQPPSQDPPIARRLSAHATCRMQRRSLHAYVIDLLGAHARSDPVPLLA